MKHFEVQVADVLLKDHSWPFWRQVVLLESRSLPAWPVTITKYGFSNRNLEQMRELPTNKHWISVYSLYSLSFLLLLMSWTITPAQKKWRMCLCISWSTKESVKYNSFHINKTECNSAYLRNMKNSFALLCTRNKCFFFEIKSKNMNVNNSEKSKR